MHVSHLSSHLVHAHRTSHRRHRAQRIPEGQYSQKRGACSAVGCGVPGDGWGTSEATAVVVSVRGSSSAGGIGAGGAAVSRTDGDLEGGLARTEHSRSKWQRWLHLLQVAQRPVEGGSLSTFNASQSPHSPPVGERVWATSGRAKPHRFGRWRVETPSTLSVGHSKKKRKTCTPPREHVYCSGYREKLPVLRRGGYKKNGKKKFLLEQICSLKKCGQRQRKR